MLAKHIRSLLIGGVFIIGLLILVFTPYVLPSVLLAMVAYYFLTPLIQFCYRFGLSWERSAQVVFFSIGGLIILTSIAVFPALANEGRELVQLFPELIRTAQVTLMQGIRDLENRLGYALPANFIANLQPYILQGAGFIAQKAPQWISQSVVLFFLAPLFTYFFLTEAKNWPRVTIEKLPYSWWEKVDLWLKDLNRQIGGFIRARVFESLIIAGLTWAAVSWIGLPFAFLLGFIAGLFNIVPYIGPVVAAVPALILALATDNPQVSFFSAVGVYILIQTLDAFAIVPFFVARIVNLHSLVVIIAILLGGYMMGVVGMIISIPVAGMLKVSLTHVFKWIDEEELSEKSTQ